jgi:diadenosine tetraphosphate (Ap4A) HIT family hydrolase
MIAECLICQKHAGTMAPPPGGYVYEDPYWLACHASTTQGPLGTLLVESRRHFLDYDEMAPEEAAAYAALLPRLYAALKPLTGAERIYHLVLLEGLSHFHAWLVPRPPAAAEHGLDYLMKDHAADEAQAVRLAANLRTALS